MYDKKRDRHAFYAIAALTVTGFLFWCWVIGWAIPKLINWFAQ